MRDNLIETGQIVNTHGIRGELRLQPWADSPVSLTDIEYFYIDGMPIKVLSAKIHKSFLLLRLEGVDSLEAAIRLKTKVVCVKREDIKLEAGAYFIADLVGITAIDAETGGVLGTVSEVLTLPAGNVYVIKGEREILVPAVSEFIVETNLEEGFVKLRLIEGL